MAKDDPLELDTRRRIHQHGKTAKGGPSDPRLDVARSFHKPSRRVYGTAGLRPADDPAAVARATEAR